jgi:hypothetical protein
VTRIGTLRISLLANARIGYINLFVFLILFWQSGQVDCLKFFYQGLLTVSFHSKVLSALRSLVHISFADAPHAILL